MTERLTKLWTELLLEENKILKGKPKIKRKVAKIPQDYLEVFSEPNHK